MPAAKEQAKPVSRKTLLTRLAKAVKEQDAANEAMLRSHERLEEAEKAVRVARRELRKHDEAELQELL